MIVLALISYAEANRDDIHEWYCFGDPSRPKVVPHFEYQLIGAGSHLTFRQYRHVGASICVGYETAKVISRVAV